MSDQQAAAPAWPAMSVARAHALLTDAPGSPFEMQELEIRGHYSRRRASR